VSLLEARRGRDAAKELLSDGFDPNITKQENKFATELANANTYELVAKEFHAIKSDGWSEGPSTKWLRMNELYLLPVIGHLPINSIKAPQLLSALKKVESKGILSTARRMAEGRAFLKSAQ
jgi:hypothetical protein